MGQFPGRQSHCLEIGNSWREVNEKAMLLLFSPISWFLGCPAVSYPTTFNDIPVSGLGSGYIAGSARPALPRLPGCWVLTEADGAFLDFAQVVGIHGQLGATAPRTAGEACRPVCAPASPFPTKVLSARESWRKDGCAIGRHAIVSGGMFPCTRASGWLFPGGAWPHCCKYRRMLQRHGETPAGPCRSSKPRGACDFSCAWPCPSLPVSRSSMHTRWHTSSNAYTCRSRPLPQRTGVNL